MHNTAKPKNIRAIVAWCLYDWANSSYSTIITTFIFSAYFTEKVAADKIIGTSKWANANTLAGLLIAVLSPILGSVADFNGKRKPWIAIFLFMAIGSAALLWFITPEVSRTYPMLFLFVIGTTSIEVAFVFYNAMLTELVPSSYLGRVSGWAWSMGYFGGILSLSLALLFVQGNIAGAHLNQHTFENIRICGPLVALWLFLFIIPLFRYVPDKQSTHLTIRQSLKKGLSSLMYLLCSITQHKHIFKFLLARMFYIDGLNTLFGFAGIYAAGVMHMSITQVIQFAIVLNISAGLGAATLAWVDDYRGSKFTIILALVLMIMFSIGLIKTHSVLWFWIFAIGVSLGVGPVQAASRSFMVHISPPEIITELFGLFALSGKATAFLGPLVLGFATLHFKSQRAGLSTILIFLIIGLILMLFVPAPKNSNRSGVP